ncbi:glycosyltransferase family 2 protein [Pseudoxanthomonas yeongjuensis]|uniref:glycosyltransferase family 2 protein n=1 Tax=Pseudoxanthomonas yeongjuensis TaxID=377616 RepID=UPI001FECB50D|nr:glycosyltransferase family 2 protein [Pseudoxanthomonas yeongjuensis]
MKNERMHRVRIGLGECPAGWYLVEGVGFEPSERMQLVVESTTSEPHVKLPLASVDRKGRLRSTIVLTHNARHVGLASNATRLSGELWLRPIGRTEAVFRMLAGLRTEKGAIHWRMMLRTLLDAAATATGGIRRAAGLVVARYFFHLRAEPGKKGSSADARLRPGPWPIAIPMQLQPLMHLEPTVDTDGLEAWEATGEDPSFRFEDHGAAMPLKAGWYRLHVRIMAESGNIVAPALYPDLGQGYVDEELIRLPDPGPSGEIDALILLKQDASALRFDPTVRLARFRVAEFDLARIGRVSAMIHMLLGLRHGDGRLDAGRMILAVVGFVRTAVAHGISTAASDLFAMQPSPQVHGGSYADWVRRYDTFGALELERLRQRARRIEHGPLISLILPVYQTPEIWLRRCLDSVQQQAYHHWELCVADDASPDPRVREVLEEYAARDARIKLVFRSLNGHIAEASNSALELAAGEFIGLLDHDDELRPHALLEMAEAISARGNVGLLYSDEDKIDAEGRRFAPYFKPDWNPDLLLSQNYICHFTVIRTDLARDVGGFRKGFEGSQDHDLILRCTERLSSAQIHHIAKILYHWRAIEGSTALGRSAKDYAAAAGARAVYGHLQRIGTTATVDELPHGHFRVRWPLPSVQKKVSIIIPTRDRLELLKACVESVLAKTDYPDYEVVVVDNRSVETETLSYLEDIQRRANVTVLRYDEPFNYSAINNWAVSRCAGELICLLNNDIEVVDGGWLHEMAGHALRPEIGAVGSMLYYPDLTIQHAGVILGIGGVANHAYVHQPAGYPGHGARALVAQNLSAVTGACLVVRRDAYLGVGGLNEQLEVAFNDVDFCLRLRTAGYRNVWTPFSALIHHESASRGNDDSPEKRARFIGEVDYMLKRWGEEIQHDLAYNPNLSLQSVNSELAFPPRS